MTEKNKEQEKRQVPKADPKLPQHQPHFFQSENEVPMPWRTLRGAVLNLRQINSIIEDAYKNQFEQEGSLIPDYGGARARFEKNFHIENGLWVTNPRKRKSEEE